MILVAVLLGVVGVVLITVLATHFIGRDAGWVAAAGLIAVAVGVAMQIPALLASGEVVRESIDWLPTLGVSLALRMDGLAALFLLIVLGVGALVMAYSARYLSTIEVHKHTGYYAWMLLFATAMTGLVLADDLVLLFVFWEITTLCSFFLINRSGRRASAPAVRTLLVTGLGGLSLLFAVVLITVETGTMSVTEALAHPAWDENPAFAAAAAALIAVAALTKSAQFPFHMWLPDAMVAPTPVSAYLHAAAMVKAGIYLLLLFSPALGDNVVWQSILVSSGLITAAMGAVFALRRFDLKEIMAYSTVSQLGFLVAVIGLGTPEALAAAALYTLGHALFKSSLFMVVGVVDQQAGTRDIRLLRGLRRSMPVTFWTTVLACLSMAGIFPLVGFIGKEYVLAAFVEVPGPAGLGIFLAASAVIAATATFAYSARIILGGFTDYRGTRSTSEKLDTHRMPDTVREGSASFLIPAVIPALIGLVLGAGVSLVNPLLGIAATSASGAPYEAGFALIHGVTVELALSILIIVLGLVVVSQRHRLDNIFVRRIVSFTAIDVVEKARTGAIALGTRVGDVTRTDRQARHLAVPWLLLSVLAVAGILAAPTVGAVIAGPDPWSDWVLLALLLVIVIPAVVTTSRLIALVLVGSAGFIVALWFFALGAIDVGLTQLLVELLTVVALVLILRRLPARFHRVTRARTAVTAAIALGVGAIAFVATLGLTGRTKLSPAGQYYLDEAYVDTGGTNIVNTILVDYRALDTFGELTVVAIAGIVIMAVLQRRSILPDLPESMTRWASTALARVDDNTLPLRMVARWAAPVIIVLSVYLLLRGHYEPGGGFISALVGGTGFALAYLGARSDRDAASRVRYRALLAAGIITGVLTGLLGYIVGSFLKPVRFDIPLPWGGEYGFTSALVFDLGVYFAVVAIIVALLNELGTPRQAAPHAELSEQGEDGGAVAVTSRLKEGAR